LEPEVDITSPLLKREKRENLPVALMDLTSLNSKELDWLLHEKVISLPILVRTLIALKQNGIEKIFLHYLSEQEKVRRELENHPVIGKSILWYPVENKESFHRNLLDRISERGCYWVNPFFLMNGIFLHAFEDAFPPENRMGNGIVKNRGSDGHFYWISEEVLKKWTNQNEISLVQFLDKESKKEVLIKDPEAYGKEIRKNQDIKKAEKILYEDVTRKKGGPIAKVLNEPISLWIAKQLAKTSIQPNTVTLWNTLLGFLSVFLVFYGAKEGLYGLMALGAILFYVVDIFDGVDGELARFTLRLSKNGALYDTISDNSVLLAFLAASTYAAYIQVQHWIIIALGLFTVLAVTGAMLYIFFFTMRHFGNASLRLYEAKFMPKIPRENRKIRLIFWMRHLYTKDIFAAMISVAILVNMPILVVIITPILVLLMLCGLIYMGNRYRTLLEK